MFLVINVDMEAADWLQKTMNCDLTGGRKTKSMKYLFSVDIFYNNMFHI